jgi:anti-sigma regulatory factor (Ser/Thr protein kinase)
METRHLRLPGTVEALGPAAELVEQLCEEAGLAPKSAYGLQLSVDELVTNIVTHAYAERGLTGEIEIMGSLTDKEVRLTLKDTGEPYDPTRQAPPDDLDKPLEERKIGGLGIFLVLKSVDQVLYAREGDANVVTLVVQRPCASASDLPHSG